MTQNQQRGVHSSVKKRVWIPQNLPKITPLDFDEINREIEEYEQKRSFSLGSAVQKDEPKMESEEHEQKRSFSLGSSVPKEEPKIDILKDISNQNSDIKLLNYNPSYNTPCSKSSNMIWRNPPQQNVSVDRSNINCKARSTVNRPHTKKTSIPIQLDTSCDGNLRKKNDDSFDLNFSALTLSTPVKPPVINIVPSTPINTLASCKKGSEVIFNEFVTPKVNNRPPVVTYSLPRNPLIKTSTSNESFANEVFALPKTDVVQDIVCTIPKVVPKDETFKRLSVNSVEYIVLSLLGKGGSSEVFQCFCLERKQLVAIKSVSLLDKTQAVGYINEVKLLQQLQHCDRIITMYDYEIQDTQKKLLMVLEKGGQDLSKVLDKLSKKSDHIPHYKLLFYSIEMIYAVKQIHDHGVIHTDLKPANFIEVIDGLKLIDFGIASTVQPDMTSALKMCPEGSCNYISPEALKETTSSPNKARYKVHFKSDVWSLGCILYQMIYGKPPFHHIKHMYAKLAHIENPNHKIEYPPSNWAPNEFVALVKRCLTYNVRERPSIEELVRQFEKWN